MNQDITSSDGVTEHTGFPNPATDNTLASLNVSQLLIKHPASTFFMEIDSSAWEEQGIYNGDLVIIDKSLTPRANDLIVYWSDSEFTLGRFTELPPDTATWGVITSITHRYRS